MKFIAFVWRWLGFLAGLGALGIVGLALASPLGWPFELVSSWPYLVGAIGLGGAITLGITGWPRFATGLLAASLIVLALAMASPGDLSRPSPLAGTKDVTTLVWGNSFGSPANVARLKDQAAQANAQIIAIGEVPREGRKPSGGDDPITGKGAITVQGCVTTNEAFTNQIRYRKRIRPRTFAIKVACPEFTLFAVHLTNPLWQLGERHKRRGEELDRLAALVKAQSGPVVVIGDFNTAPNAAPMNSFIKHANLNRSACGGRWLPTWRPEDWRGRVNDRNPLTGIPIDHLFTRDVEVVSCAVGKDFGSDHLPLVASFRRPTPR